MKDRGKVTIFICLIVTGLVVLGLVSIRIVSIYCAMGKASIISKTSMSDIKASYNSYIFEHYHILLFDINCSGKGEGAAEKRIEEVTAKNLGSAYDLQGVYITNYKLIYENECEELKKQIEENAVYELTSYGIDEITNKLDNREGSYSELLEQEMNSVESDSSETGQVQNSLEENETGSEEKDESNSDSEKVKDPRKYTRNMDREGMLLMVVLPLEKEVSRECIQYEDLVSTYGMIKSEFFSTNVSFDSYDTLKKDMKQHSSWGNGLVQKANVLMYAGAVFNCFTENNINDEAVLDCELEYIISGKQSDYSNLEDVCRRIIAIRLPVNMAYIVKDSGKMKTIKTISVPLSASTMFLSEPVIRYLIAGAWSYIEAIAEVRNLLAGNSLEFVKNKDNWITDIMDIENSLEKEQDSNQGLSYKDYLMILLAMENDNIYYRMLDIMDINVRSKQQEFKMLYGITELEADFDVLYQEQDVSTHQKFSYLQ